MAPKKKKYIFYFLVILTNPHDSPWCARRLLHTDENTDSNLDVINTMLEEMKVWKRFSVEYEYLMCLNLK